LAQEAGLDPDFAERLLHFIIEEVIKHHSQIAAAEFPAGSDGLSARRN
jgi:chorismate mutase